MIISSPRVRDSRLFSYAIGSADLYHEAIAERNIYFVRDSFEDSVVKGILDRHDFDDTVNLSYILLEYTMSCEEARCQDREYRSTLCLGERLGQMLAEIICDEGKQVDPDERVKCGFDMLVRSLGGQFTVEATATQVYYYSHNCPFDETARSSGIRRTLIPARQGFVALCRGMLRVLSSSWQMTYPNPRQARVGLKEIMLAHHSA
jgi:hypothetical protein